MANITPVSVQLKESGLQVGEHLISRSRCSNLINKLFGKLLGNVEYTQHTGTELKTTYLKRSEVEKWLRQEKKDFASNTVAEVFHKHMYQLRDVPNTSRPITHLQNVNGFLLPNLPFKVKDLLKNVLLQIPKEQVSLETFGGVQVLLDANGENYSRDKFLEAVAQLNGHKMIAIPEKGLSPIEKNFLEQYNNIAAKKGSSIDFAEDADENFIPPPPELPETGALSGYSSPWSPGE